MPTLNAIICVDDEGTRVIFYLPDFKALILTALTLSGRPVFWLHVGTKPKYPRGSPVTADICRGHTSSATCAQYGPASDSCSFLRSSID